MEILACIGGIQTGEKEGRFHWLQITETLSCNLCKIVVTDIRPAEIISPCPITRAVYLWNECGLSGRRVRCTRPRQPGPGPRRASPRPRPRDSGRGAREGEGGVVFVCIWILIGVARGVHPSGFQDYCQNHKLSRVSLNDREILRGKENRESESKGEADRKRTDRERISEKCIVFDNRKKVRKECICINTIMRENIDIR